MHLTYDSIQIKDLSCDSEDFHPGAKVIFLGKVRNHSQGKKVLYLEYEAYESMAESLIGNLIMETKTIWKIDAAVDGFAIREDAKNKKKIKFRGEIPAGHTRKLSLKPGEAMAIFTGAPTPQGTQAVVMQEYAQRVNGSVILQESVENFENIRMCGEDFKTGDPLISKGTRLEPQHLALPAALGRSKVRIIRPSKVAVLAAGSEIIRSGKKLQRGQIYDSNTPLLEALLKQTGACPILLSKVCDNLQGIRQSIRKGLQQDVLIICGGVSVGKYDFVKEALRQEGVREIFWKVNIKPGKPILFGKKGKTLVFGLPGNPVSVYVTFEEFVKPALLKMNRVTPLKGQGSHQIGTLAKVNGILKMEAHEILRPGQPVRVQWMSGEAI